MDLREDIAKKAYDLFEKSGFAHGKHEEHWREAEKAIKNRIAKSTLKNKAVTAKDKAISAIGSVTGFLVSKPTKKESKPQGKPAAKSKKATSAKKSKTRNAAKP